MRNSEIVSSYMALADIIGRKEKYPVKFSFALSKNAKTLEQANKDFEEERNKLLDEYNVKDSSGKPVYQSNGKIEIAPEHEKAWRDAVGELLEIDVDVSIHKVSLSVLDGLEVEADVLFACNFMIEE